MVFIQTAAIFIYAGFSMVVLVPIGIFVFLFSVLGLKKPMAVLMYRVAQFWAVLLIKCTGCPVTVTGRKNIPRKEGICFVSNHGSIFDIVLLLAYAGRPIGFVAKKELLWIPFLNMWILLIGGLFIDRGNIRKAVATINSGVKRIRAGDAMIIFPEGHRSKGQGLLPFRSGAIKLATQSEAPIVPVAIAGSYDIFEKNYRFNSVPMRVTFCEPIPTAGIPPAERRTVLVGRVRSAIAAALEG
jgi:1-acyl-sn-glycerol-3-phosphate acyltransferase